jgi:hypothetical protein
MIRFFKYLLILMCLAGGLYDARSALTPLNPASLRDGDLIFQTSTSSQSMATMLATRSATSHMGIVKKTGKNVVIIEAVGPVQETSLQKWLQQGMLARVTVARHQKLSPALSSKVLNQARKYYGQPYDPIFLFNNGRLYCSELPYLAYRAAGLPIGRVQQVGELQVGHQAVDQLMRSRWKANPTCKGLKNFEACKPRILKQELVTPVSILHDNNFRTVYSNYPPILTYMANWLLQALTSSL